MKKSSDSAAAAIAAITSVLRFMVSLIPFVWLMLHSVLLFAVWSLECVAVYLHMRNLWFSHAKREGLFVSYNAVFCLPVSVVE